MNSKVSVIVPVYNMQEYIDRCLESLKRQTLKDIEIIVVNDGSTDQSREILKKWEMEPNFKILDKKNGGLSDARNFGLAHAQSPYVAFVDSDDWVSNEMLEDMYGLAIKHNSELVFCQMQKVDERGVPFRNLRQLDGFSEKIDLKDDFSCFGEISCFACNKIFQKELFTDKLTFPKNLYFEDIATVPRLLTKAKTVAISHKAHYNYFERISSMSRSYNEKGLDIFKACAMVKEDFKKSDYAQNTKQWKRFFIYQGVYSYLAYWAFVKDRTLKQKMLNTLQQKIHEENISKKEILLYRNGNKNYLLSLPFKKMLFYLIYLVYPKLLLKF